MITEEQKARLKELKSKGELTAEEKAELGELNKLESGKPDKTFTQEEVNGIVTKESRKAVEKLLKEMGIEDVKSAKDGLKQLKEIQDKDKTDLEKLTEENAGLLSQIDELKGINSQNDIKIALLGAGVTGDDLGRYTKLYSTYEGETVEDNIKSLMEEFPLTPAEPKEPPPPLGDKSGSGSGGLTMEQQQTQMDEIMGVK